ncbi:MAG: hypothetical protein R2873_32060 [Caldilineaceae bacterium]
MEDDVEGEPVFDGLAAGFVVDFGEALCGEGFEREITCAEASSSRCNNVSRGMAVLPSVRAGDPPPDGKFSRIGLAHSIATPKYCAR